MSADEIEGRRQDVARREQYLHRDAERRANDEGREPEDDRQLRDIQAPDPGPATSTPVDEPPPVHDDRELRKAEDATKDVDAGPERHDVGGRGERAEHHRCGEILVSAGEDPDRDADHAHRDPAECPGVEMREQRVAIERAE